jgi:hypothetical protein
MLSYHQIREIVSKAFPIKPDASGPYGTDLTYEALTVSLGVIIPTPLSCLYSCASISGEGGIADNLTLIVAPTVWIGKLLLCRISGFGDITVVANANNKITVNFVMNTIYDRILLECVAINTWVQHYRSSNV